MSMKSYKVSVGGTDAAPTFTGEEATVSDIFTTSISTSEALTGTYGLLQKAGLVVVGMAAQSKRMGGGFNPFAG